MSLNSILFTRYVCLVSFLLIFTYFEQCSNLVIGVLMPRSKWNQIEISYTLFVEIKPSVRHQANLLASDVF